MDKKCNEKILFFDLETSHAIAAVFGGGKQYVGHEQILKDRKILTISYMWKGEKKPTNLMMDLSKHELMSFDDDADKSMLQEFVKEYNKADAVVAHNGRKFDIQRLTARLFKYQLPPLNPILVDDTYTMSKPIGLTFRKLDYIAKVLGLGRKIKTDLDLWIDIVWKKSKKALKQMSKYNSHDVVLLAKAYSKILPYGSSRLNRALLKGEKCCVDCGSSKIHSRGFRFTRTGKYRYFSCQSCGSSRTTERRSVGSTEVR